MQIRLLFACAILTAQFVGDLRAVRLELTASEDAASSQGEHATKQTPVPIAAPAAAEAPDDWGDSQWITSELVAPDDAFVKEWRDSALLDLKAQGMAEDRIDKRNEQTQALLALTRSPVVFRKQFTSSDTCKRATLRLSGLGYYHARLNGEVLGDHALAPNMSHFDVEARFQTFEIADLLRPGENVLEVSVAPGRLYEVPGPFSNKDAYNETPLLRAHLRMETAEGLMTEIASDTSWQASIGPVRRAAFWVGEAFDARETAKDWQNAALASGWNPDMLADDLPLQRVVRELQPIKHTEPQPGVHVYDFGRMTVGKVRLKLPARTRATVRYAEMLVQDVESIARPLFLHAPFAHYSSGVDVSHPGMIRPKARGSAPGVEKIKGAQNILLWGYTDLVQSGEQPLTWNAAFDYVGFRYVEITGLETPLPPDAVTALEMHNDLPRMSTLEIAHPGLQAVADAAALSILLNAQGTYEDNPGAERMGANSNIAMLSYPHAWYAFDNQQLARKAMHDSRVAASIAKAPTTVTLTRRHTSRGKRNKSEQTASAPITVIDAFHYGMTPMHLYKFYGDEKAAAEFMEHCAGYFEEILGKDGYPRITKYGDHLDRTANLDLETRTSKLASTDNDFVVGASALWQGNAFLEAASLLRRDDLIAIVRPLLEHLRKEIDRRHLDTETGRYAWKTSAHRMGANTLAIMAGLVPEAEKSVWIQEIVDDIASSGGHVTTGSRLTGPLLSLLSLNGHLGEAMKITTREEYPSPLAMTKVTGGTISESWGQPGLPAGASLVQAEGFAAAANWIYEALVGIAPTADGPGFQHFKLSPHMVREVPACSFRFQSPQGEIVSAWKHDATGSQWDIQVPQGASASVKLPYGTLETWKVNGQIEPTGSDSFRAGPGSYALSTTTPLQ